MTFKKLFLAVFSVLLVIGLAGCFGKKDLSETNRRSPRTAPNQSIAD